MFQFFGLEAYGILNPQSKIEPTPPKLEDEVPNIGLSGKSYASI